MIYAKESFDLHPASRAARDRFVAKIHGEVLGPETRDVRQTIEVPS